MNKLILSVFLASFVLLASAAKVQQRGASAFTNTFQGCFGGSGHDFRARRFNRDNLNARCIDYCRENAFPVAATKQDLCACAETLLGLLPRLARPEDGNATGVSSPCNRRCPGTPGSGPCNIDTCCGGDSTYSVFIVGNVDSVKAILTRSQGALSRNGKARLKDLWKAEWPDFTKKAGTRLYDHYTQSVERTAEDCWEKCKRWERCHGSSWSDKNHMAHAKYNCWFFSPGGKETQEKGWTTYLKGKEREHAGAPRRRLWNHYAVVYNVKGPLECRKKCLERRDVCGGVAWTSSSSWPYNFRCFLYKYGQFRVTLENTWYGFIFEDSIVEVETTATPLNDKGEQTGKKKCRMSRSYNCRASTETAPAAKTDLEANTLERQLVLSLGKNLAPMGKYDFEKDNTGSKQPAKVTKVIRISEASARQWNTEAGADVSYTVGSKLTATVGAEIFGVSASTSVEMSQQFSVGGFFKAGYSKTTTSTIEDEIRVEYVVPAGRKLFINFFKESYDLQVKWRALMVASGKVQVKLLGNLKTFYLSEVLSLSERTVYAFGTIELSDRERIVSIAKEVDPSGAIKAERSISGE